MTRSRPQVPAGRKQALYDACHLLLNEKIIEDWSYELGYWSIKRGVFSERQVSYERALEVVHSITALYNRRWFDWQWIRERTGLSIRRARNASKVLANQPL